MSVLTKIPRQGFVKTRLINGGVAEEDAYNLYEALLQDAFTLVDQLLRKQNLNFYVAYWPKNGEQKLKRYLIGETRDAVLLPQEGNNLSERIASVFDRIFRENSIGVVVCPDHPGLDVETLETALKTLQRYARDGKQHMVLGPTCDGGIYLIGFTGSEPIKISHEFDDSNKVMFSLVQKAKTEGISYTILDEKMDIDYPEDIILSRKTMKSDSNTARLIDTIRIPSEIHGQYKISVIIPTFNEEKTIDKILLNLKRQTFKDFEIILVDGDSEDATLEKAATHVDKIVVVNRRKRKRQYQENVGARGANGEILLFLYADTSIPSTVFQSVADALADPQVVGGGGKLEYRSEKLSYRLLGKIRNIVSEILDIYGMNPYFFVRKATFIDIEGFNEAMTEEAVDASKRLRRHGNMVRIKDVSYTSVRRFERRNFLGTVCIWAFLVALAFIGIGGSFLERYLWKTVR